MAFSVIAVSISVSPFFTEELATDMFMTSAPSRFAGELEGGLRAGRGFEEEVDLRAAAQRRRLLLGLPRDRDGRVGAVEQQFDVVRGKVADAEQMAVREERQGRRFGHVKALL